MCLAVTDIVAIWGEGGHELLALSDASYPGGPNTYRVMAEFDRDRDAECRDKFLTMLHTDQGAALNRLDNSPLLLVDLALQNLHSSFCGCQRSRRVCPRGRRGAGDHWVGQSPL